MAKISSRGEIVETSGELLEVGSAASPIPAGISATIRLVDFPDQDDTCAPERDFVRRDHRRGGRGRGVGDRSRRRSRLEFRRVVVGNE
mgnify:CR=1 FL=1